MSSSIEMLVMRVYMHELNVIDAADVGRDEEVH